MPSAPTYLDCAATTPIDPQVCDEVVKHLTAEFGNAGSRTHDLGLRARRAVEKAREQVAAVVGAGRGDVFFTSGATEANNLAILGLAEHGRRTGKKHIVSTQIEHKAVLEPLDALSQQGFVVTLVPPERGGWVSPRALAAALRDDTLLVSVMHVNNETGVVQPIEEIAALLADHPAFFHVDAAQGFGKLIEPLRNRRIDLISLSGHKIHAPKGIGALISRRGRRRDRRRPPLTPLMYGGGQERGLRPGTLPVPLIVGLGKACEIAVAEASERNRYCQGFKKRLMDALLPLRPEWNGDPDRTVPQILSLCFPGLDSETAMEKLSPLVAISNGSACTSQSETCSHVLAAMRCSRDQLDGVLRFSWCHMTEEPDWSRLVAVIASQRRGAADAPFLEPDSHPHVN